MQFFLRRITASRALGTLCEVVTFHGNITPFFLGVLLAIIGHILGSLWLVPQVLLYVAWFIGFVLLLCGKNNCAWLSATFILAWALQQENCLAIDTSRVPSHQWTDVVGNYKVVEQRAVEQRYRLLLVAEKDKFLPSPVSVTLYQPTSFAEGTIAEFHLRLKSFVGVSNFDAFDYATWALTKGYSAQGYVKKATVLKSPDIYPQGLQQTLQTYYHGGVIAALLLGEVQDIRDEVWDAFRLFGLVHLLVISGSHIALLCGFLAFCFVVVKKLGFVVSRNWQLIGQLFLLGSIFVLLPFGLSIFRSVLITAVALLLWHFGYLRRWHHWYFISVGFVLLVLPFSFLSAGFWFSFVAVWVLGHTIQNTRWHSPWLWLWNMLHINILLFVCLLPLQMFFYQQANIFSPFVNSLCLFALLFALPFGYLGLVTSDFGFTLPFLLLDSGTFWLLQLLEWVKVYAPFTQLNLPALQLPYLLGMQTLVFVFVTVRYSFGLLASLMLFVVLSRQENIGQDTLRVHFFDVGAAMATLIQTQNKTLLLDTGPAWANSIVQWHLQKLAKPLDTILVSSFDSDHAGGFVSIAQQNPQAKIIFNLDAHKNSKVSEDIRTFTSDKVVKSCVSPDAWQWDGFIFEVMHPNQPWLNAQKFDNNASCVLRVRVGEHDLWFFADIYKEVETLLSAQLTRPILLWQVAHHGSKSSTTEELVKRQPIQHAVVSVDKPNRFFHPSPQVLQRLAAHKVNIWQTWQHGAIVFTFGKNGETKIKYSRASEWWWQR